MVAPAETTVRTTTRTNLADRFKSLRTHLLTFATLNVLHDVITAAASVSVRCRAIFPRKKKRRQRRLMRLTLRTC